MKSVKELGNYVYTLTCPITGRVFYVGEGKGYRAWSHTKPSSFLPYDVNYPSHYGYIKKLHLLAQEPEVNIIHSASKSECLEIETKLIEEYGVHSEGGSLLQTKSLRGVSKPWSREAKDRYRENCKNNRKFQIDKDTLSEMYVIMGMTRKQIADHYGCSDVLIKSRLKEFNIRKEVRP